MCDCCVAPIVKSGPKLRLNGSGLHVLFAPLPVLGSRRHLTSKSSLAEHLFVAFQTLHSAFDRLRSSQLVTPACRKPRVHPIRLAPPHCASRTTFLISSWLFPASRLELSSLILSTMHLTTIQHQSNDSSSAPVERSLAISNPSSRMNTHLLIALSFLALSSAGSVNALPLETDVTPAGASGLGSQL